MNTDWFVCLDCIVQFVCNFGNVQSIIKGALQTEMDQLN